MDFLQHHSSSSGNLYELDMIGERVLIDPGVSLGKIRRLGIGLSGASVWRSHSHLDHCRAYSDLVDRMALQVSTPARTWEMQHDVPCLAAEWVEAATGESLVYAIDTGSFDALPDTRATIYALECNYQDQYLEQDHTSLRVRQNHASLDQVIAYLGRCDLSDTKEIHILHLSSRHAEPIDCAGAIRRRFGVPVHVLQKQEYRR